MSQRALLCLACISAFFAFAIAPLPAFPQTTISTGGIVGTVSDATGALIPAAKVTITNKATGRTLIVTTSSGGLYNSGPLPPAEYMVRVEAVGFSATEVLLTVQVNNTSNGNVVLQVGKATTTVEVESTSVQVNTDQATVQGVITTTQIENLPINGRNFLQLAQLEPGVQIQDGATFDPTKNGFASISFGGRWGRSARIEVDGGDISDENVGTVTTNIPASAIQEFQVEQSSLDLSSGMTSSGSVNITTRSGSNAVHGEAFDYGRWHNLAARVAPTISSRAASSSEATLGDRSRKTRYFSLWMPSAPAGLRRARRTGRELCAALQFHNQHFKEWDGFGRMDWQVSDKSKHSIDTPTISTATWFRLLPIPFRLS